MKLQEVLTEEQLEEKLRHAIAAAAIAAGALGAPKPAEGPGSPPPSVASVASYKKQQAMKQIELMAHEIQKRYKIDRSKAKEIVTLAKKYEKEKFPKAEDILSVIGIESSFKPASTSGLAHDPAVGLMQVRPGIWGLSKTDLNTPEKQIKVGSEILDKYYKKLGTEDKAVHAYNVGITNFKKGENLNPGYVEKFKKTRDWIVAVSPKLKKKEI